MNRFRVTSRWMLVGGWVLMMPPVPLGTALPPLSAWSPLSVHKTAEECERTRGTMRASADVTVHRDPNASALKIATAFGQLQARCVEKSEPAAAPASPPAAATAPAPPAAKP